MQFLLRPLVQGPECRLESQVNVRIDIRVKSLPVVAKSRKERGTPSHAWCSDIALGPQLAVPLDEPGANAQAIEPE